MTVAAAVWRERCPGAASLGFESVATGSAPRSVSSTLETARGACSSWSRRVASASTTHPGTGRSLPRRHHADHVLRRASLLGSPSIPTTRRTASSTSTTRTPPATPPSRATACRPIPTWPTPPRAVLLNVTQPPFTNHKGGQLAFGRTATSTSASATAERGDPDNRAQNRGTLLGSCSASTSTAGFPTRFRRPIPSGTLKARSRRSGVWPPQPLAVQLRSADGRPVHRRRRPERREEVNFQPSTSPGGENYAGAAWKDHLLQTHRPRATTARSRSHPRLRSLARVLDHRWLPLTVAAVSPVRGPLLTAISALAGSGPPPRAARAWSTTQLLDYDALDHDVRRGRRSRGSSSAHYNGSGTGLRPRRTS